jgi:hypothetical protein
MGKGLHEGDDALALLDFDFGVFDGTDLLVNKAGE